LDPIIGIDASVNMKFSRNLYEGILIGSVRRHILTILDELFSVRSCGHSDISAKLEEPRDHSLCPSGLAFVSVPSEHLQTWRIP